MKLATSTFNSIVSKLDSDDIKLVTRGALDAFAKTVEPAEVTFLKALAVIKVDASKLSRRDWAKMAEAEGTHLPSGTGMGQLADAYKLVQSLDIDITPLHVSWAYRITANIKAADRKVWLEDAPTGDPAFLEYWFANYKALVGISKLDAEPSDAEVAEAAADAEVAAEGVVALSGFASQLVVLETLAQRIATGDFTAAEAIQLATAARGVMVSAEAFVANNTLATVTVK